MLLSAFYYTNDLLKMFRAPLCPSSGAHDYIPLFTTWNVCFLDLDGGKVWVGWLCSWLEASAVATALTHTLPPSRPKKQSSMWLTLVNNCELLMMGIEVPETC
jgi:uncharacterized membrane protein YecN with MAPEG domain